MQWPNIQCHLFKTQYNVYFCTSWSQMKIAPPAPTHKTNINGIPL